MKVTFPNLILLHVLNNKFNIFTCFCDFSIISYVVTVHWNGFDSNEWSHLSNWLRNKKVVVCKRHNRIEHFVAQQFLSVDDLCKQFGSSLDLTKLNQNCLNKRESIGWKQWNVWNFSKKRKRKKNVTCKVLTLSVWKTNLMPIYRKWDRFDPGQPQSRLTAGLRSNQFDTQSISPLQITSRFFKFWTADDT